MIIFHHVPKTAGSTFNHAVAQANSDVSCLVGAGGLRARPEIDFSSIDYLGGHITYQDAKDYGLTGNNVHVSLIRDPLKRIVSYFEMAFRDNRVFREEICLGDKWGFGFEVFYERFIVEEGLTNLHCKYFSVRGKFYDAVVSIVDNFHVVGSVERFDDFKRSTLTHFDSNQLIKPTSFPVKNKSSVGEDYNSLINPNLIKKIEHDNRDDFDLVNWLNKRYDGLFISDASRA